MKLLKDKLRMLQSVAPKASRYGQLYRDTSETKQAFKRIKLWTLFVSDDNEHMIRDHVFESRRHRTPKEWHEWFAERVNSSDGSRTGKLDDTRLEYIQRTAVLPGLSTRTGLKSWAVEMVIGWRGDAKHRTRNPAVGRKRNKTKSKTRARG